MTDHPKKAPNVLTRRASSEVLADRRDKTVREQLEKERAASTAKTSKLRALRLAKEEADRAAQQERAADKSLSNGNFRIVRPK